MAGCSIKLGYVIQVPIWPEEARGRSLPADIARFLLYDTECARALRDKVVSLLADQLLSWRRAPELVYACPLVPFLSSKRMDRVLSNHGMREKSVRLRDDLLIRCEARPDIEWVLRECKSETTVFITSRSESDVCRTLELLDEYPQNYPSFEVPLLERREVHGAFVFASEGHASLEVLGTEEFVLDRCVRSIVCPAQAHP
jgi:hypothetical protein